MELRPGGHDFIVPVKEELPHGQEGEKKTFVVTLKKTSTIYAQPLVAYYNDSFGVKREDQSSRSTQPVPIPTPESIAALEFLIRQYASTSPYLIPVGRSYFRPDTRENVQKSVLKMMKGVYGSVRLIKGAGGLGVNVDVSHGLFYPDGALLDILVQHLNKPGIPETLTDTERNSFVLKFRNVLFTVTHRGAMKGRYRLSGLSHRDAFNTFFEDPNGNRFSVADYFASHYNKQLRHPRLPLIEVRRGDRTTHFPIEVCEIIPYQRYLGRVNEDETTSLVKFATSRPTQRRDQVEQIYSTMKLGGNEYLDAFGADIDRSLIEVDARRLQAPGVVYKNRQGGQLHQVPTHETSRGVWNMPAHTYFVECAAIDGLLVVCLANRRAIASGPHENPERKVADLVTRLLFHARSAGIDVNQRVEPITEFFEDTRTEELMKRLQALVARDRQVSQQARRRPSNLMLIILPTDAAKDPVYTTVKKIADTVLGITTQCIKPKWVRGMDSDQSQGGGRARGGFQGGLGGGRGEPYRVPGGGGGGGGGGRPREQRTGPAFFTNVVLKLNAKLGGSNTRVSVPLSAMTGEPTMILGIDATHPPPNSNAQSIAAVVASMDDACTSYRASVALLPPRDDSIKILDEMMVDLIRCFTAARESEDLPRRIIVFRDGVSEGQFEKTVNTEVGAIKRAARFIGERILKITYEPKITFIVVQKRHHTRFFFDQRDSDNKRNALPGTVVDRGIVHPKNFEYYLYSHPGLQGTSRPTKYQVLYDENRMTSDSVQLLSYQLCFLYARTQRAVSIPSPVYYAHLTADRARCHLRGGDSERGSVRSGGDAGEGGLDELKEELRTGGGLWFI